MTIFADFNLPGVRAARTEAAAPRAPRQEVARALSTVSEMLAPLARGLEFAVDAATGEDVVRVVDSASGKVLRQIPSQEMLAIARALDRVQGLLFRAKA